MAASLNTRLLRNNRGQSAVEYILLIAVLSALGYAFFNNARFKDLIKGNDGMFATMKKGMMYSYRYGLEYNSSVQFDDKMSFEYNSKAHDTYSNGAQSRFFEGTDKYPK